MKFGVNYQENKNSAQVSLFGESSEVDTPEPIPPIVEEWNALEKLRREKEIVGVYISGHPLDDFKLEIENYCNCDLTAISNLEANQGRDLKFAGIVTDFAHLVTKNGKPFGKITVEDYMDSATFFLFSDDYIRFKEYMMNDWFLYIKGKAQKRRWGDPSQMEFKITSMEILGELREKVAKSITIDMELKSIREPFISELFELIDTNRGKCRLFMNVIDADDRVKVEFRSKSITVGITNELVKTLEDWPEVKYKLG